MADDTPFDPRGSGHSAAPGDPDGDLAALHELLLRDGRRWRQSEPSTARLERHVQALAQLGAVTPKEGAMLAERNPTQVSVARRDAPPLSTRARSRWRGLLPAAAAVLLVALAGSLFAWFGAHHAGPVGVTTHSATPTATTAITRVTAVRPQQTHLPLPANGYLTDISFSSAHDGWAVGGIRVPDQPSTVLIHYHDGVWTASSDTIPNAYLSSVSMISVDDGWAVGLTESTPTSITNSKSFLLHYTGGQWQRVDLPTLTNVMPESLPTIHMVSSSFGYLSGTVIVPEPDSSALGTHPLILIYQNGTWTAIPNTFAYGNGAVMVSPSEGWVAAGDGGGASTIYHYLNGVWTQTVTASGFYWTLTLVGPRDIWAASLNCVAPAPGLCTPVVYHYDGISWSPASAPVIPGFDMGYLGATRVALTADAADEVWYSLATLENVPPPGGQWRYQDNLYAFRLGAWTRESLPIADGEVVQMTTDGNGGTWAIMRSPLVGDAVLYTSGTTWSVYGQS
ncbi:MAG TPA: hypothetical protein VIG30_02350 [Ktedonobacterales bacterium]|jgi:hypothetical protein